MNEYYGQNSFNQGNQSFGAQGPQLIFCSNCGAQLTPEKRFCPSCGAPVTANTNNGFAPPPQQEPVQANPYFEQQNMYSAPQPEPQYYAPQPEPQYYAPQPEPQYVPQPEPQYVPQPEPQYYAPQPEPQYIPQPEPQNYYSNAQDYAPQYSYSAPQNVQSKPARDNSKLKSRIFSIVGSSFMLILAIIMFVSCFVSAINIKEEEAYYDEDITIKFSSTDILKLSVNSFKSVDEEDLWDEYDELEEKYEKYQDDWQDGKKLDKYSDYMKEYLLMSAKSEDLPKTVLFGTTGTLSILQLVFATVCLITAIITFITTMTGKSKSLSKAPLMFSGLTLITLITNLLVFKQQFRSTGSDHMQIQTSPYFKLAFVALAMGVILTLVIKIIEKSVRIRPKEIVKRSLAVAFAVVLLISAFAPILTTDIKAQFENEHKEVAVTAPIKSDIFNQFVLSKYEKEDFEEWHKDDTTTLTEEKFQYVEWYTKREMKKDSGDGYQWNLSMAKHLTLIGGAYKYSTVFTIGTLAQAFIIFAALFMIWYNICDMVTRRKTSGAGIVTIKVLAIWMSLIMVAIPVVMMIIINFNAGYTSISYTAKLAYGPIMMAIAAIALSAVPATKKRELNK